MSLLAEISSPNRLEEVTIWDLTFGPLRQRFSNSSCLRITLRAPESREFLNQVVGDAEYYYIKSPSDSEAATDHTLAPAASGTRLQWKTLSHLHLLRMLIAAAATSWWECGGETSRQQLKITHLLTSLQDLLLPLRFFIFSCAFNF